MNPEDDPEARIRELERPLADVARASELGGSQSGGYTYPPGPPPPPYSYGGPFGGPSPRSSSGNRAWWILAAVVVVGVLVLVGGIAAFAHSGFPKATSSFSRPPRLSPGLFQPRLRNRPPLFRRPAPA